MLLFFSITQSLKNGKIIDFFQNGLYQENKFFENYMYWESRNYDVVINVIS
ncbi:hypothetical protein Riv7116_3407 [Rivularia sp. PCC 7116]|nr:hypothetical protein Riv7116_3407 [Rivularia sp. PCC 7116]